MTLVSVNKFSSCNPDRLAPCDGVSVRNKIRRLYAQLGNCIYPSLHEALYKTILNRRTHLSRRWLFRHKGYASIKTRLVEYPMQIDPAAR